MQCLQMEMKNEELTLSIVSFCSEMSQINLSLENCYDFTHSFLHTFFLHKCFLLLLDQYITNN